MSELKQQLEMRLPDDPFTYEELQAVVGLLAGPGHVWQLEFGLFVLLQLGDQAPVPRPSVGRFARTCSSSGCFMSLPCSPGS